ncbi:MAG: hypothetical protein MUF02_06090 [Acidobacteria bacterium]|jgi:hypothetical protein|nr:hypothetical protein [Acidobacteriota bacterium]
MLKQKVFFFAARAEGVERMIGADELRAMAVDYVRIYGAGCLADPETPTFVRQMLAKRTATIEMPRAG